MVLMEFVSPGQIQGDLFAPAPRLGDATGDEIAGLPEPVGGVASREVTVGLRGWA